MFCLPQDLLLVYMYISVRPFFTKVVWCWGNDCGSPLILLSSCMLVLFSRLKEAEKPFCERLYRLRDLMDRSKVSIEEVICELGKCFDRHLNYKINN